MVNDYLPFRVQLESSNIGRLLSKAESFDFDVKLHCGINLQRPLCWDANQKNALLDAILKGVNIGALVFIETFSPITRRMGAIEVIDGKQRLSTILDFCLGKLSYEWNGIMYFFKDLCPELQNDVIDFRIDTLYVNEFTYFNSQHIPLLDFLIEEDTAHLYKIRDADKLALFDKFAYKGTPIDKEHLAQVTREVKQGKPSLQKFS